MISGHRMNDRWKRGILPFKMFFHLSRYDIRFPRYPRVKRKLIFNRFLVAFALASSRLSIPKHDSWKNVIIRISKKEYRSLGLFVISKLSLIITLKL